MSTATETRSDVQLWTGVAPEKHAHLIRVADRGVPRVIDGAVEALCGFVWVPSKNPANLPVCAACRAVFEDNEAMALAMPETRAP